MRALKSLRVCLWSVLLAVAACSDPADPGAPMPDGGTSTPEGGLPDAADPDATGDGNIAETCAEYARSGCDYITRCMPFYLEWNYGSYAKCLAQTKDVCTVLSTAPGTSWTPPQLLACAKAEALLACDDYTPVAACEIQPGAKEKGASCVTSAQCASKACLRERYNSCGVCGDKAPDGAACTRSVNCQSGQCIQKTCAPVLNEGDPCPNHDGCRWDLVCSAGTCQKPTYAPLGQSCSSELVLCEGELVCENEVCSKPKFADVGERCGFVEEGRYTSCRASDCNERGICVSQAPAGAPCPVDVTCAGFGLCTNGTCKAYTADVCETPTPSALTVDTREFAHGPRNEGRAHRAHLLHIE